MNFPQTVLRAGVLPSAMPLENSTLKILILSDLHLPVNPEASRQIAQNKNLLRSMDLIVLLGDQCGSFGTEREYAAIDRFVRELEKPYTAINGNHEFYFQTPETNDPAKYHWTETSPDEKRAKLARFQEFFSLDSLWGAWHCPLGAFIFLGLDDVENHKTESLSAAQYEFLESSLNVAPHLPAWVFCHAPLMLEKRLDMVYYDEERSACVEPQGAAREAMTNRASPVFWMSGHIHLRPDHPLFPPYQAAPNIWQIHCPDSWGFSRWLREQRSPQRHGELYSRHLEITSDTVTFVTHDHWKREDISRQTIDLKSPRE